MSFNYKINDRFLFPFRWDSIFNHVLYNLTDMFCPFEKLKKKNGKIRVIMLKKNDDAIKLKRKAIVK